MNAVVLAGINGSVNLNEYLQGYVGLVLYYLLINSTSEGGKIIVLPLLCV